MPAVRKVGYLALLIGFVQVVFGAVVRISGSGLGCGDHWPDCFGAFTPTSKTPSLLVEISHRYGAAALSVAIIALALIAFRQRDAKGVAGRGGALRPALLAVLLVIVAALFGAVTVKMELNPIVVVTHLAIAMSLLAVLVVVVVRAGGFGATRIPARYPRTFRSARAAVGLTFLALVLGALTANTPGAPHACLGFPWCRTASGTGTPFWIQVTHRIIAFLLLGHLTGIFFAARRRGESTIIRRATSAALGIMLLQIVIAAAMVELNLPPGLRSLHQAVGTSLWICVVALAALASGFHGLTEIERIVYESPSRGEFATPEGVST
ncbi:MAG TPA: COX15/CtaA family protein [Gemmatimonadaceae bacterium]|nr:COX15/CtaA family protein [Gemmatimonadaceae bacterium]